MTDYDLAARHLLAEMDDEREFAPFPAGLEPEIWRRSNLWWSSTVATCFVWLFESRETKWMRRTRCKKPS